VKRAEKEKPLGLFNCLSVASCLRRQPSCLSEARKERKAKRTRGGMERSVMVGARAQRLDVIMLRSSRPGGGEVKKSAVEVQVGGKKGYSWNVVKSILLVFARAGLTKV
jgi:hypothetical protein